MREDGAYGPYSPEELANNYDGSTMAGTWVLEKDVSSGYVVYDDTTKTAYFVVTDPEDVYPGGSIQTVASISGENYTGVVYPVPSNGAKTWDAIGSSVEHVIVVDAMKPRTMTGWFAGFSACTDFDIGMLDMSEVTSMDGLFSGCTSLTELVWPESDTSQVTSMIAMFGSCENLVTLDVSELDTDSVTVMRAMFSGCTSLSGLDLSSWNVSNLENTNYMFTGCKVVDTIDTSGWDTSSLNDISYMFNNATVGNVDLSHWDVSNVITMERFCISAEIGTLNLSNWDVSNVQNATGLMHSFLGHLIMPDMHWANITSTSDMFYCVRAGSVLDIPRWSFGKATSGYYMFAYGSAEIHAPDWDLDGFTSIGNMFRMQNGSVDSAHSADVSGWHSTTVQTAVQMFNYTSGIDVLDVSNWDMPALTNIEEMFGYASGFKTIIGLETWDVSKIQNMKYLFEYDSNLESIDVSTWNPIQATSFNYMFASCPKLTSLDLSNWDTPNVTDTANMFSYCSNLEFLDISGFDMSHVTSMGAMFSGLYKLNTIVLGGKSPWATDPSYTTGSYDELPTLSQSQIPEGYSGKWIREDKLYGPYTPAELRQEYNGAMAGTWVWQEGGDVFRVIFEAPDGAVGSMPMITVHSGNIYYKLPANKFRMPGATFARWRDNTTGSTYSDESNLWCGAYNGGETIILTAVFDGYGGGFVDMQDGAFEFKLKADEMAVFDGLPADMTYQVYEETPSGWELISSDGTTGVIVADQTQYAGFTNEFFAGKCSLILSGEKFLDENRASDGLFQFELLDEDGNVVSTAVTGSGGNIVFDALQFTDADVGHDIYYTVREVLPNDDVVRQGISRNDFTYDTHEDRIRVVVSYGLRGEGVFTSHTDNFYDDGKRAVSTVSTDEPVIDYYHSLNMDDNKVRDMETEGTNGNPKGDYISNRPYASIVRISNAMRLHVKVEYTNPRGNDGLFVMWNGDHNEVRTGVWSEEISPDTADHVFAGENTSEILVSEFDVTGDSLSVWYVSEALSVDDPNYTDTSNFGYHITVTASDFFSNVRSDGSLTSDYSSDTDLYDVVTVPGAESLQVNISYSNPRGVFCVWAGNHSEDFNVDAAVMSHSTDASLEGQLLTESFEIAGDTLTILYHSTALSFNDSAYNEYSNYGYFMEITPINVSGMADGFVKYASTPNIDGNGTQDGTYARGRDYVQVVTIPGATSLNIDLDFDMDYNDGIRIFSGSHPTYSYSMSTYPVPKEQVDLIRNTSDPDHKTLSCAGDTVTIVFHAHSEVVEDKDYYGYRAVIKPRGSLFALKAEAFYDDDGATFFNESSSGYLQLTKANAENSILSGNPSFVFELSFYDEHNEAYDPQTEVFYSDDMPIFPVNQLTVDHICVKQNGEQTVLYTETYPQLREGDSYTVTAKSFSDCVYSYNDYTNGSETAIPVTIGTDSLHVALYYERNPYLLVVRHMLYDEDDNFVGYAPEEERYNLYEGDDITLSPHQYEDYIYYANNYELTGNADLRGQMPGENFTILLRYKPKAQLRLEHRPELEARSYRIELDEDFSGLRTATYGDIDFVDGVGQVTIAPGEYKDLYLYSGARLTIYPVDHDVIDYAVSGYFGYIGYDHGSFSYSNREFLVRTLTYNYRYVFGASAPYSVQFIYYFRYSSGGNGYMAGYRTYLYIYDGEILGTRNSPTETYGGTTYYYGGQDVDPATVVTGPLTVSQNYYPERRITVNHIQVATDGTETTVDTEVIRLGARTLFSIDLKSYDGYVYDNAVCVGETSVPLEGTGPITGTLGADSITVEIRYVAE